VNIRTTLIDGEPWFVAADVCRAPGLRADASKDSRIMPTEFQVVVKQRDLTPSLLGLFRGTDHRLRLLSESGLYKLIMRSDKAEALAFQHWIASEVLPSIRNTGSYALADHGREAMPLPLNIAEAIATALNKELAPVARAPAPNDFGLV
jgi:prophage antirepressor-like protein